jgi:hypothetical protein
VTLVESFRPQWREGEGWRVGPEPLLRIGVVEGEVAYQFDGVTGAVRLADGTVVVADAGYQEVRFFDPRGTVVRTVGGPGEGPGEFAGLAGLGVTPDGGIWAFDFMLRRITWLNASGEMAGVTTLAPEPPVLHPLGVLPDGTFLLKQLWGSRPDSDANVMGLRRDPLAYVRFGRDGALLDTVGLFPGRELFITEDETGRDIMGTPPFARTSVGAVSGAGFVEGSAETFELWEHGPGGEALKIFRLQGMDLTLGPEDRDQYIRSRLEGVPPERRGTARADLEAMPFPETRPAYGSVTPDAAGNLWIAEWASYPAVAEVWIVLEPDGEWLGEVMVPPRFLPYHIGDDWILGVEWDALDVEYVVLYPLLKGEGVERGGGTGL